jgi:hypothetical protein
MQKRLLVPSRVRQVPRQFSWVDQRAGSVIGTSLTAMPRHWHCICF